MTRAGGRLALAHLSDEAVAAFADGVLREAARARAQQHLGGCSECREAVRGQRAATAVLRAAPLPCLPAGLAERLLSLPGTTSVQLSEFGPAALSADNQPMFAAFHNRDPLPVEPAGHHRGVSAAGLGLLAITAVTVSLLASTAASAGGVAVPGPVSSAPSSPGSQFDTDRPGRATVVQFDLTGAR